MYLRATYFFVVKSKIIEVVCKKYRVVFLPPKATNSNSHVYIMCNYNLPNKSILLQK